MSVAGVENVISETEEVSSTTREKKRAAEKEMKKDMKQLHKFRHEVGENKAKDRQELNLLLKFDQKGR